MTATQTERLTEFYGNLPTRLSLPVAANVKILMGTLVAIDSSGRAIPGGSVAGRPCVGKAIATFDNTGGAAGAFLVEIECGVFAYEISGAVAVGQTVWCLDNQTVIADSDSGARGVAGVIADTSYPVSGSARVLVSPLAIGLFSDDSAVESAVLTLQGQVATLLANLESDAARVHVPLTAFRLTADGAAIPAWADGTNAGFSVVNSEILGIRWNPSQATSIIATLPLPADLDGAVDVVLQLTGFRIGTSDAAMVLAVGAFMVAAGQAHNADANAGGNSTAFDGATNVLTTETLTLALADVPAPPALLTLTIAPDAALDADDFVLTGVELLYTRAALEA